MLLDDITKSSCDCIINAANMYLKHGGGVALAISTKGGPQVQRESDEFIRHHGPLKKGEVAVTGAGKLAARYIIHTVGPRYGEGSYEDLMMAYLSAFRKADELNCSCISSPAVSAGTYGFPAADSANAMIDSVLTLKFKSLKEINVYLFDINTYTAFLNAFKKRATNRHE